MVQFFHHRTGDALEGFALLGRRELGRREEVPAPLTDALRWPRVQLQGEWQAQGLWRDPAQVQTEFKLRQMAAQGWQAQGLQASWQTLAPGVRLDGAERLPSDPNNDVARAVSAILGEALPVVYDRYAEGAAKATDAVAGITALAAAVNFEGLPAIFHALKVVTVVDGRTTFRLEGGPLHSVLSRISERTQYGETPTGRALIDFFGAAPFGWEQDVVRLLVLCLIAAGAIDATSAGQTITTLKATGATNLVSNANVFKGASFRPRRALDPVVLIDPARAFEPTFGKALKVIAPAEPIADELRAQAKHVEEDLRTYAEHLRRRGLAGADVLDAARDQLRAIERASANDAVVAFVGAHRTIKDGLDRLGRLRVSMSDATWAAIDEAFDALATDWAALDSELADDDGARADAADLRDRLPRESFYEEVPAIARAVRDVRAAYADRREGALDDCIATYRDALDALRRTPGWETLSDETRARIDLEVRQGTDADRYGHGIATLRTERDACDARLKRAVAEVRRLDRAPVGRGGAEAPGRARRRRDRLRVRVDLQPLRQRGRDRRVHAAPHPQRGRRCDQAAREVVQGRGNRASSRREGHEGGGDGSGHCAALRGRRRAGVS